MLLDINQIKVAERIRKEFGNIEELANDIKENGLINPPVVTPEHELIAGERRLRACQYLNYQQIEVRVMSVRDYEHKLKIEIGENEHRKEFTFSERMAWARELERVESAKAKERQGERTDIQENFPEGRVQTRDIVAEKIGIGSGKQYEKAKFITENADSSTIAKLDNEEISIHKAYTELKESLKEKDKLLHQETERRKRAEQETFAARKSEQLTRKQLEEREEQEPQIIEREVVKEVVVESKEHINIINKLKDENAELKDENQAVKDEATFYKQKTEAMSKSVEDMEMEESSMNYMANKNVHNLIAYMDGFLKDSVVSSLMRGSIANASDATKELLDSRIEAVLEFINDLRIAKTGRKIN
ncbi:ParB-like partition protein [Bacillus cereus VD133]|uniref:ParB-like partition protein n=1 Tax=Bacillus cereus VD133 TaxID=1053233 RepID=A0A9W5V4M9_BACCE|nr:ParB N-terminal domain-containing protein [Bacillus cereus]EOO39013.1 ParB-like partition protein [Bacillus cereus VD133]